MNQKEKAMSEVTIPTINFKARAMELLPEGASFEACLTCGQAVERRMIGQRSTHFCPVCQPFTS